MEYWRLNTSSNNCLKHPDSPRHCAAIERDIKKLDLFNLLSFCNFLAEQKSSSLYFSILLTVLPRKNTSKCKLPTEKKSSFVFSNIAVFNLWSCSGGICHNFNPYLEGRTFKLFVLKSEVCVRVCVCVGVEMGVRERERECVSGVSKLELTV